MRSFNFFLRVAGTVAVSAAFFSLPANAATAETPALSTTAPASNQSPAALSASAPEVKKIVPPVSRVVRGLTYATVNGGELKLDLYLPFERAAAPRPLLVWIHGGGWQEGNRSFCPLAPLAKADYVVASLSYRFTQQAKFPAQIEDCKAAIRWLRTQAVAYDFDPALIGVAGESAGGLLAALLGASGDVANLEGSEGVTGISSRVQAVVALCPPSDFTLEDTEQSLVPELLNSPEPREVRRGKLIQSRNAIITAALGGTVAEHRELARLMSPLHHVTRDDPPFYLIHGDRDELIPMAQSEILRDALEAVHVPVRFEIVPGAGHGFGRLKPEMLTRVKEFFDQTLTAATVLSHAP